MVGISCAVCGTGIFDEKYYRDSRTGAPLYYADPKFWPILTHVHFCSAKCSMDWVDEQRKTKEVAP